MLSHFKDLYMICVKKLVVIKGRTMDMRHQGLQRWILHVAVILTCFQLQGGNYKYVYVVNPLIVDCVVCENYA